MELGSMGLEVSLEFGRPGRRRVSTGVTELDTLIKQITALQVEDLFDIQVGHSGGGACDV